MARNVNEIEADEAEQGGNIPESDPFLDVLRDINALKNKGKKISGDMSARLTKAESQHGVNKKAFRVVATCSRMESDELHSFLRHFDAYREYAGLDAAAGADLFEGATRPPEKAARAPKEKGHPKIAKVAKLHKAARKAEGEAKTRGRPKGSKNKKAPEPVSAAEAAAQIWGITKESETAGAA